MSSQALDLSAGLVAPDLVFVQAVDATSRHYDTSVLAAQGEAFNAAKRDDVFVSIFADGNDVCVAFYLDTSLTLDDTAANTAGTAWTSTYTSGGCWRIASGTGQRFMISRTAHRHIYLKCASGKTANARIYFSSMPSSAEGAR